MSVLSLIVWILCLAHVMCFNYLPQSKLKLKESFDGWIHQWTQMQNLFSELIGKFKTNIRPKASQQEIQLLTQIYPGKQQIYLEKVSTRKEEIFSQDEFAGAAKRLKVDLKNVMEFLDQTAHFMYGVLNLKEFSFEEDPITYISSAAEFVEFFTSSKVQSNFLQALLNAQKSTTDLQARLQATMQI